MWESREAVEAALPQIMGLSGERSDDWTERPDEVLRLTELKLSRYSEDATPAGGSVNIIYVGTLILSVFNFLR